MDKIRIFGGNKLIGKVIISGSKNATLPIMISSLLTDKKLTLDNVPKLADILTLNKILSELGCKVSSLWDGGGSSQGLIRSEGILELECSEMKTNIADYQYVSKMRASFLVLGPLLGRCGYAKVSMPGGCAIGIRPIDQHLYGLKKLGAKISIDGGYIVAEAKNGLVGNRIKLRKNSVGATQNIIMAAVLARGESLIENAAQEPEIEDMVNCLKKMGLKIDGAGTKNIIIQGTNRSSIEGAHHTVMADRIEAGTYATAVCMTGGKLELVNFSPKLLETPFKILNDIGCDIKIFEDSALIERDDKKLSPVNIITKSYPGFPTDLQAQFMALLTHASGESVISEKIFENRFMHVQELVRMGADIKLVGDKAIISGKADLLGAQVMATDLRASVSLVIAALVAKGETTINRVYHLDRGFEKLEEKISACGGMIERIN
tara:strand:+ start:80693 stop:81994 length:1302 start_codon:yes stop_codon:yes gene_type:complete